MTAKFLHAMIRTTDPKASMKFYCEGLGLKLLRQRDSESGQFSLYFIGLDEAGAMIELTHNWDNREYSGGDQFGHIAYEVENIYDQCQALSDMGVDILRPPRDGRMAFVKDPNGISIELLQKGAPLESKEPWASMENRGSW